MVISIEKRQCTGCAACANVCPVQCIQMKEDKEGFLYPDVNYTDCIRCGQCTLVCIGHQPIPVETYQQYPKVYAGWTKNTTVHSRSSSGGIFTTVADYVIRNRGEVWGARVAHDCSVSHSKEKDLHGVEQLRGSKYVQSNLGDSYKIIKQSLKSSPFVLFVGTPCQVYGLHAFLGEKKENLFTIDLVCHGVSSPKVWREYCKYQENAYKSKIIDVSFRDKKYGWENYGMFMRFANGDSYYDTKFKDYFLFGFRNDMFLRPACYECKFSSIQRYGDITLADYWLINRHHFNAYNKNGTSMILINTLKGEQMLDILKDDLVLYQTSIETAIQCNPCLVKPSALPRTRDKFFSDFHQYEFGIVIKKHLTAPSTMRRIIAKIINKMKRMTRLH